MLRLSPLYAATRFCHSPQRTSARHKTRPCSAGFISGRPKDKRLGSLNALNESVTAAGKRAHISDPEAAAQVSTKGELT